MKILTVALLAGSALLWAHAASAATIAGPTLDNPDGGWSYAGVAFHANQDATLTGFTFQNQGQADTVVLTDLAGNILQSLVTPEGVNSFVASVAWALTGGADYRLLQVADSNAMWTYGDSGVALSNPDISMTATGIFGHGVNDFGINDNTYWAAFNDITTTSGAGVPEPATWALMLMGFGLIGATARQRKLVTVTA